MVAATLGFVAAALFALGGFDSLSESPSPAVVPGSAPSGLVQVTVSPADAQIFVFVGRGPASASGLAVGAAHEFVVLDDGLQPSRAVVPEGASWGMSEAAPLYELAVQALPLDAVSSAARGLGEPTSVPGAASDAAKGTVRVITNPLGAKVYRFVGQGPSAQISAASIHEGQEVLVYRSGHETRRAVVGPSDWQLVEGDTEHRAALTVELPVLAAPAGVEPPGD